MKCLHLYFLPLSFFEPNYRNNRYQRFSGSDGHKHPNGPPIEHKRSYVRKWQLKYPKTEEIDYSWCFCIASTVESHGYGHSVSIQKIANSNYLQTEGDIS